MPKQAIEGIDVVMLAVCRVAGERCRVERAPDGDAMPRCQARSTASVGQALSLTYKSTCMTAWSES